MKLKDHKLSRAYTLELIITITTKSHKTIEIVIKKIMKKFDVIQTDP